MHPVATLIVGAQEGPYGQGPGVTGAHTLPRTGEGPPAATDPLAVFLIVAASLIVVTVLILVTRACLALRARR